MNAEIDISGRIEETNKPSALALTNGISICLLISAREKRAVLDALKRRRPERAAISHNILVYSTLIFLALREHHTLLDQVTIDLEYMGYDASIKEHVLNLCSRNHIVLKTWIVFRSVGKKSPAHELAIRVFRGKQTARRTISADEILREHP